MTFRPTYSIFAILALLLAACGAPDEPGAPGEAARPGSPSSERVTAPSTLETAPDFTLPTLRGDSLRLADLRGEPVLLNFWATWCTPCIAEMPDLQALHDELGPHGLHVIGISLDEEGASLVGPFVERLEITYPIVLDDGAVAEAYGGVWALPTTYVLDGDGDIVHRVIGLFPTEEMRPQLRELLNLPPAASSSL